MAKVSLINTYKKYPAYKDSGVEWLDKIPSSWDTKKIQWLFNKVKRTGYKNEELLSVYRDYGVIPKNSRDDNFNKESDDLSNYQLVKEGDLAINKMKAWQGSLAISKYRGIVSPAYFIYKPFSDFNSRFIHYLLRSDVYIEQYKSNSGGVRNNQWDLDHDRFRKIEALLPPKEEQERIARFLDEQTARIDETIAKKQQFIELLKEKRTAIINHVVTKGLDHNAKLVDSGIEWLGEVNSSFEIIKLRYLVKVSTGSKDTANADPSGEYPFFVRSPKIEKINSYTFDGEAVLTAGDGAGVGKVFHYYKGKLDYHQRVYLFSNFKKVTGKYFYYYLSSNLARVVLMGESKSTVDSIRLPQLLKMPFTIPDIQDQDKIVCYLDKETKKFDELLDKVSFSIAKLQEFKSSLISHAVTGKIKV